MYENVKNGYREFDHSGRDQLRCGFRLQGFWPCGLKWNSMKLRLVLPLKTSNIVDSVTKV